MGHSKKAEMKWMETDVHTLELKCGKTFSANTKEKIDLYERLHRKKCDKCKKGEIVWSHSYKYQEH